MAFRADGGRGRDSTETGVLIQVNPGDQTFPVEIQRARESTATGLPTSSAARTIARLDPGIRDFDDPLPLTTTARHYRARHVSDGYTDGAWTHPDGSTSWARAIPEDFGPRRDDPLGDRSDEEDRRLDTFYSSDRTFKAASRVELTPGSAAASGVNRHNEIGFGVDGEAISFTDEFDSTPQVNFTPQVARVFDVSLTTDQYLDMKAVNPSSSGFTLRAKIVEAPIATPVVDGWSTAQGTAPGLGGSISSDGALLWSRLASATSAATTYECFYTVAATSMQGAVLLTVGAYYNQAVGSTVLTLGASRTYDAINSTAESLSFAAALGSSFDLALQASYDGTPTVDATITGETSDGPGVQYEQIAPGSETSMTPSSSDGQRMMWHAMEAP
jgi:hypothetical protein